MAAVIGILMSAVCIISIIHVLMNAWWHERKLTLKSVDTAKIITGLVLLVVIGNKLESWSEHFRPSSMQFGVLLGIVCFIGWVSAPPAKVQPTSALRD